jgi:agmatine deiminase
MTVDYKNVRVVLFSLLAFSCSKSPDDSKEISGANFYTQANSNRLVAEWEPASGVMIVWPLSIPHKLVIELSNDTQLYTLVENETTKLEAIKWYKAWGIDTANTKFIYAPQGIDSWWVRDWGPSAVFTPNGEMMLGDGKYIYSTPASKIECADSLFFLYKTADNKIIKTDIDDNATVPLGKGLKTKILDLPFINTGGNVITDGLGTAFSTCILTNENRFYGVSDESFLNLNRELLGIERYNIISNFERGGIQHIDCFMKLLDEERILIAEPPQDHELFEVYQSIIQNEISKLKTPYGRPYSILRIKSGRYREDRLAAYTNSIIINKTIYVPLFQIAEDKLAIQRWQEVMPGYIIKGFEFDLNDEPIVSKEMKEHYTSGYGWSNGDALHCRTRAIWNPEMLFMSMKRIDSVIHLGDKSRIYATLIDYSKKGLQKEKSELLWRLVGNLNWNALPLKQIENTNHYYADIPEQKIGNSVEYYISAVSNSGRSETLPRTAPLGTYSYSIK